MISALIKYLYVQRKVAGYFLALLGDVALREMKAAWIIYHSVKRNTHG